MLQMNNIPVYFLDLETPFTPPVTPGGSVLGFPTVGSVTPNGTLTSPLYGHMRVGEYCGR